ncbi:MAG: type IV pili methyl-accepting chemotaxis transducer N-terminal domain-containing protein [Gammaproteobacteria bacterium]|nr:type IV pili methyl-accepting chemotaxis transducer N-terminal domain-containing protein [Gammaproteobacteria bacterium]
MVITFVGVSAASALAATGPTAAEYGVVLNLSGKQRMLTQKMSKEIMLVALDVDKAANLNNLAATASLFDKTLKGLRDGDTDLRLPETSNGRIRRQLDKVDKIWIDFHTVVKQIVDSGTVSPEQIENVATQNLPLLKEMNKCVNLYEKDASGAGLKADPALAVTINLSGKQRMLTQKMSKEFLLVALDHDRQTNKLNLLETYTLFERTLKGLKDGDATLDLPGTPNETIRRQLDIVDGLWKDFKQVVSYAAESATTSVPREKIDQLAAGNLPLLSEMNNAVGMYEKEAAK